MPGPVGSLALRELRRRLSTKQQVALLAAVLAALAVAVLFVLRLLGELAAVARDEAESYAAAVERSVAGTIQQVIGLLPTPPPPPRVGTGSRQPPRFDVLTVRAGVTHTVAAGTTESYARADIDGTLTVDGTLKLTG